MGYNKLISAELAISFRKKFLNLLNNFFFTIQWDSLLMYHKFEYKLKISTLLLSLGGCLEEKIRQISGA